MAEHENNRGSSSASSAEVSVKCGRGVATGESSTSGRELAGDGGAVLSNGGSNSSGTAGRNVARVNTLPLEVLSSDIAEPLSSSPKMERSKTERHRGNTILAEEAAQIFDDRIPVQQKLKLLNRIATVKDDGTVEFEVPGDVEPQAFGVRSCTVYNEADDEPLDSTELQYIPPLQIVILIVGTRGDVQPFVAIGKKLQDYGHRVRLATHSNFKEFVLTAGLEFYPIGGDPKILAEWHTHVAEALKVPLHVFFTMPWTPTSEFPHPLSRVKQSAGYRLSYQIVDSLIWLGIRDMVNDLRKKKLKLRPVTYLSGSQGSESDVPYGYIWSPHLVPKPKDWGPKVDVVGFCFLDLASNYEPPRVLMDWLKAGPKPIYIGFGSLPVQEPEKMTQIIVEALETTGQRGIINKGWGGLGNLKELKDFVYLLDNCPHDWLFLQCAAVVHHGGAGTTAAGLKAACPTTIVPFFGDQPFWGDRVHARGVGPAPIPIDEFSLTKLVDAIKFMLDPKVKERAVGLSQSMQNEDGVSGAVKAFFKHLPHKKPRPEPEPDQVPAPVSSHFFSISKCFGCA
ncbi:sterol 3-beta-glucosyltransferase UGT80A2-like isoform X2 [Rhododendron vialii]|uniref:sterol 3-beta-glucosyltransferase UGT80A2-like isoform X2 n=1 Tax=Rhododendron vialii TaxID=182163 RepID=UPI00265DCB89|nr:sterol 3-beta-glucosyltransferase UGT80A2-like isoform X2 [Rhododendron vialii]